jgi:drug/metabolite transporter (DMT)-like permease
MALAGSSVVVAKIVVASFPVFLANELRFLVASAVLVPLTVIRNGGLPRVSRRDAAVLVAQAVTGVFLFNVCLLYGVELTTAAAAGIVTSTTPVVVAVLGVAFLGEPATRGVVAGVAFVVLGVLALEVGGAGAHAAGGAGSTLGNGLVFLAVLGEAAFTVLGKAVSGRVSPLETTTAVSVLGCLLFLPFAVHDLRSFDPASVPPVEWVPIVYYGLAVTVLAFVLWFRGLAALPASTAGAFTGVLPVSAVVLSAAVLGEAVRVAHVVGVACVLAGIASSVRRRGRRGAAGE